MLGGCAADCGKSSRRGLLKIVSGTIRDILHPRASRQTMPVRGTGGKAEVNAITRTLRVEVVLRVELWLDAPEELERLTGLHRSNPPGGRAGEVVVDFGCQTALHHVDFVVRRVRLVRRVQDFTRFELQV